MASAPEPTSRTTAPVGLLAVGCVTPLGEDPAIVWARLAAGEHALVPTAELRDLADPRAGVVIGPDLGPWLARRKDLRLLPRAAVLALPAAGRALVGFGGDREELGIFVAVGREPPDAGEAEPAFFASARDGRLDRERLAAEGRALYPPLLPLRTLPNMVLAHVAIQHGIRGENATFAGGWEAGVQALAEGVRAIREGRCVFALVGAAASNVDLPSARDRLRLGLDGAPGEAAVFALLGPGGRALPPGPGEALRARWRAAVGDTGGVEGLVGLLGQE
jgi:3-oxoacyl-(acyl-carrier-protein) synthase